MVREELTPEYRKFYNACAKLWGQMMKEFDKRVQELRRNATAGL